MAKVLIHTEEDGRVHLTDKSFSASEETICGKKLHPIMVVHTPRLNLTCTVCIEMEAGIRRQPLNKLVI